MKALVVFESSCGQSEQIAKAVAKGLGTGARAVEVTQAVPADVENLDLLVVGGPPSAFSIDKPSSHDDRGIRQWLADLPEELVVAAATFEIRVPHARNVEVSTVKAASRELMRHRHAMVVRSSVFYPDDVEGTIADDELHRATDWGQHLAGSSNLR